MNVEKLEDVVVVVVNHNAGTLLVECIQSVIDQAVRVVVVDNASRDGSMALLASSFPDHPRLQLIFSEHNLGFAAGCNIGLAQAPNSDLLFLNPDCIMGPQSLEHMVVALKSENSVGMVGGLLTNLDGSEQGGGRRAVPTPWRSFVRAFGLNKFSQRWPKLFFDFHLNKQPLPTKPLEVEAISGALMLVRRAAVEDVGLWDENYFLHCEDLDWCMRFRQRDWRILFVANAPVVHHLGHSSKARPFFVEWHKHKGMVRFYRKFFGHQYPGVLMWGVRVGVWLRFGMVAAKQAGEIVWQKLKGGHA